MIGVYDLLTLGVAVVGYAMGQSRGFAWQVSGLVTLIGGAVCATVLARPLGPVFGDGVLGGGGSSTAARRRLLGGGCSAAVARRR